jgi:outer membrane receptor protein involved in Fe transport
MKRELLTCLFFLMLVAAGRSQSVKVTVSGVVKENNKNTALPFVTIVLNTGKDSVFIAGTISGEDGRFSFPDIKSGDYLLEFSYGGYQTKTQRLTVGHLSNFIDLGAIELAQDTNLLNEVTVTGKTPLVSEKMDKKTFDLSQNISQAGGSLLEAIKNLPGITTGEGGKVQLRGSEKVMILLDGKQTAVTGFGAQTGLDNIPASSIEKIEIINNPSSKYDANGNAGIINIIYKKEKKEGFNGKFGLAGGLGALWIKKENYPGVPEQYQATPKVNPSISLNYRKNKMNIFLQGDELYTKTLNKNEFVDRFYDNGDTIKQQTKRNRTTNMIILKTGMDWFTNNNNTLSISGLFSSEKILDRGDQAFFNNDLSERKRLWSFLEDELKTTATAFAGWQHKFKHPGRLLNAGFNYTFHREDEKYFFTNTLPTYTGLDSFKLISDEHVADFNLDYTQPLRQGRFETGFKFRRRYIPTNMQFKPGLNSPLDSGAGGQADYGETIPAIYGNYIFENAEFELEAGIRVEYVRLEYDVNPNHPVYKSDGYNYTQPFPNLRFAYKIDDRNRLSVFYNRRVDRPNEVDIRIFPKYDDAEIIKVGNPALQPQFTNTYELGFRSAWSNGFLFSSLYHKAINATISRISSTVGSSNLIYAIFQNAGKSYNTGIEFLLSQNTKWATFNFSLNGYQNIIDSFTVVNLYPVENTFSASRNEIFSGNIKLNSLLHLPKQVEGQVSVVYQLPDLIPQGKIYSRFSIDLGIKKIIQRNRGEIFANATDVANTLQTKKEITGKDFQYTSTDYFETQVFRLGYSYKF